MITVTLAMSPCRRALSISSRHHRWRGVPPHRPGAGASGTALSDVRQAIPLEAARQPLLQPPRAVSVWRSVSAMLMTDQSWCHGPTRIRLSG